MSAELFHVVGATSPIVDRALSGVRIGCILDPWTYQLLRPEAVLLPLTPDNYRDVVDYGKLDLVLVSAAWESADGLWQNPLVGRSDEGVLDDLLARAAGASIPSVFWDTDEPLHAAIFGPQVRRFDALWSTSVEGADAYQRAVGRHVQVLDLGIQPRIAHPFRSARPGRDRTLMLDGWGAVMQDPKVYQGLCGYAPTELDIVETRYEIYASKVKQMGAHQPYVRGMIDRTAYLERLRMVAGGLFRQPSLSSPQVVRLQVMEALACGGLALIASSSATAADYPGAVIAAGEGEFLDVLRELPAAALRGAPGGAAWREVTLRNNIRSRLDTLLADVDVAAYPHPILHVIAPSHSAMWSDGLARTMTDLRERGLPVRIWLAGEGVKDGVASLPASVQTFMAETPSLPADDHVLCLTDAGPGVADVIETAAAMQLSGLAPAAILPAAATDETCFVKGTRLPAQFTALLLPASRLRPVDLAALASGEPLEPASIASHWAIARP